MNTRTIVGLAVAAVLVVLAVAGPAIAPYGVNEQEPLRFETNDAGRRVPVRPPYPPSREHLLGTDEHGYDTLTRMLYGARYTVGFVVGVAAVRLALAVMIAGAGHLWMHARRPWRADRRPHRAVGTAVPEFAVAYIALVGIAFNPPMSPLGFAVLQGVLLTVIGLPGLVPTLRTRMERAASQSFVEAQVASGADEFHVFRHTVLPDLLGDLGPLVSHEALLVALVTGELALFNVFVGGTRQTFSPAEYSSRSHEWVGLVGENAVEILGGRYRLVLVPLLGYLLVIVALVLLGEFGRGKDRGAAIHH